jgi:hypothetical protein
MPDYDFSNPTLTARGMEHGLATLQGVVGDWAINTFPDNSIPAVYAHLEEEFRELGNTNIKDVEAIAEECADIVLLLLTLADLAGFDLQDAAVKKFNDIRDQEFVLNDAGTHHKRVKA